MKNLIAIVLVLVATQAQALSAVPCIGLEDKKAAAVCHAHVAEINAHVAEIKKLERLLKDLERKVRKLERAR